jgi:RimJ/RimL family protein N-acetyltransferase
MNDFIFETERLFTRPWALDDAETAFTIYGDPEVMRYLGGNPKADVDETRKMIEEVLERVARMPAGMGSFPLIERESGEQVGTALIKPLPDADKQLTDDIEIGWHLARRHWGKGFATEMGRALLRYGFTELDIELLHAVVEPPNEPSQKVARRIGMKPVGRTHDYYGLELEHFVLAQEDWS